MTDVYVGGNDGVTIAFTSLLFLLVIVLPALCDDCRRGDLFET